MNRIHSFWGLLLAAVFSLALSVTVSAQNDTLNKEQAAEIVKERLITALHEHKESVDFSNLGMYIDKYGVTACYFEVISEKEFYYVGIPTHPSMKFTIRYYDSPKIEYSDENTKLLNDEMKKYTDQVDMNLTDIQKAGLLYDLVIENNEYKPGWTASATTDHDYCIECSPLTLLTEGHGNCVAYSRLYSMLLTEVGVKSTIAGGIGTGGAHCWNQIMIDDKWYNADVQIADSEHAKKYGNPYIAFLKSDKHFYNIGYRMSYSYRINNCDSTKYDTERFKYTDLYWK